MDILGVGLSRTGTRSLAKGLALMGLRCVHYAPDMFADILLGKQSNPSFRRFNNVDAVFDIPAAMFYREIGEAYPDCRFILTVRDPGTWFESIRRRYERPRRPLTAEMRATRLFAYGSVEAREFLYKKRFREHNELAIYSIPPEKLLVMDVISGDGWDKLCPFLGL